jgi:hypothetical protein
LTSEIVLEIDEIMKSKSGKSDLLFDNIAKPMPVHPSTLNMARTQEKFGQMNKNAISMSNIENYDILGKRNFANFGSYSEAPKKQVKLADLFEGFRKGQLQWDQMVFNKQTVEYLQKNSNLLFTE